MSDQFTRFRMLVGNEAVDRLGRCHVAVFGIGGVGGNIVETLARSGVGKISLIDHDTVSMSNINRQIIALTDNIGKYKVDEAEIRIKKINPSCEVIKHRVFYLPETADMFDFSQYDYVADAVDTVTAKLSIIEASKKAGTRVISCMGTGNKLDPTKLVISDIYSTSVCPLARIMRHECRKRGISDLRVLYSTEPPVDVSADLPSVAEDEASGKRSIPGSCSFVPPVAGTIIGSEIIKDLIGK